jgi:hypothetical protein
MKVSHSRDFSNPFPSSLDSLTHSLPSFLLRAVLRNLTLLQRSDLIPHPPSTEISVSKSFLTGKRSRLLFLRVFRTSDRYRNSGGGWLRNRDISGWKMSDEIGRLVMKGQLFLSGNTLNGYFLTENDQISLYLIKKSQTI